MLFQHTVWSNPTEGHRSPRDFDGIYKPGRRLDVKTMGSTLNRHALGCVPDHRYPHLCKEVERQALSGRRVDQVGRVIIRYGVLRASQDIAPEFQDTVIELGNFGEKLAQGNEELALLLSETHRYL